MHRISVPLEFASENVYLNESQSPEFVECHAKIVLKFFDNHGKEIYLQNSKIYPYLVKVTPALGKNEVTTLIFAFSTVDAIKLAVDEYRPMKVEVVYCDKYWVDINQDRLILEGKQIEEFLTAKKALEEIRSAKPKLTILKNDDKD